MPGTPDGNRLHRASSPYLLQHRHNPVDWYEWGEEALQTALREDKPILLSVGYAACHWCHVMAHESFEDPATAALMNEAFVNIKVDREERPEIDQVYMEALHQIGIQGGWPLTAFLTPAGELFWAGTYFPPLERNGLPSFPNLLRSIANAWRDKKEALLENAGHISQAVRDALAATPAESEQMAEADFDQYVSESIGGLDPTLGGSARAPKFPNIPLLECLLYTMASDANVRNASKRQAERWLTSLGLGGIYDHLGGGIHRYAVDSRWLVPHFEKMLYDNALFLRALSLSIGINTSYPTRNLFRHRIEETIAGLQRDFTAACGALISSHDADSEGEEGRFYVWHETEIDAHLGAETAHLFKQAYDVKPGGNWEGKTVLHRLHFKGWGYDEGEEQILEDARATLHALRSARPAPSIDDKILTDWNGLAIRAVADCAFRLNRPDWMEFAKQVFHCIAESVDANGRLPHSRRGLEKKGPALLTDIAAMVNAAVSLYALTGRPIYRDFAARWITHGLKHHSDGHGSFYFTADDAKDAPMRTYHDRDEATPSASGQWLEAIQRAALAFSDPHLQDVANTLARRLWGRIKGRPHGHAAIMNALRLNLEPKKLVIRDQNEGALISAARTHPDAFRLDVIIDPASDSNAWKSERPAAWLCSGPVCLSPVHDPEALSALLMVDESG